MTVEMVTGIGVLQSCTEELDSSRGRTCTWSWLALLRLLRLCLVFPIYLFCLLFPLLGLLSLACLPFSLYAGLVCRWLPQFGLYSSLV